MTFLKLTKKSDKKIKTRKNKKRFLKECKKTIVKIYN